MSSANLGWPSGQGERWNFSLLMWDGERWQAVVTVSSERELRRALKMMLKRARRERLKVEAGVLRTSAWLSASAFVDALAAMPSPDRSGNHFITSNVGFDATDYLMRLR